MATIRVDNLRARAILGINDDERVKTQDLIINYSMNLDITEAAASDDVVHTVDYKAINKRMIDFVEDSSFFLIEKLVTELLALLMEDKRVSSATVRVDKPTALRFADSVSLEETASR